MDKSDLEGKMFRLFEKILAQRDSMGVQVLDCCQSALIRPSFEMKLYRP